MGEAAALGSAILWALASILMGAQAGRLPALVISALRSLFAAGFLVVVAAVMLVAGRTPPPPAMQALGLAGSGVLGFGIGDTLYIGSLGRVGVSRAFPISMAVYPLLTIILAVLLLGEAVTPVMLAGTFLIIWGVYLIVSSGQAVKAGEPMTDRRQVVAGVGLVVMAAALWALASVWLRVVSDGVEPVLAQALRLPLAGLVTAMVAAGAGYRLHPCRYSRRDLMALLVTGIIGTGVGSLLFLIAVQRAGAALTAVLSSSAPLFAMPMAALLLGERVTRRVAAGTAISIVGIWLVLLG